MEEVTEVPPAISNPVLDPEPEVIEEPAPVAPPVDIPENPNDADDNWKRNLITIVAVGALALAVIAVFA